MKKLFSILLFVPLALFGQDSLNSDSLYFIDGKVEGVEIIEIDDLNVKYKYRGEPFAISTNLKKISKILTAKGRIIQFEHTLKKKTVFTIEDWDKVEITNLSSDVEGLNRIGNVTGKAKGLTTLSSSGKIQNRAMNKMRMQAAFYGCDVVYMLNQTNTDTKFGTNYSAGQTAGSTLSGTCYSINKPDLSLVSEGAYYLTKAYKLGLNDMTYKDLPIINLNRIIYIQKDNFVDDGNYFIYPFQTGLRNAENKISLLKSSAEELVFLIVSRSIEGSINYYNLFFSNKIPSSIDVPKILDDITANKLHYLTRKRNQITFENINVRFVEDDEVFVSYRDKITTNPYTSEVLIIKIGHNRIEFYDKARRKIIVCYLSYLDIISTNEIK